MRGKMPKMGTGGAQGGIEGPKSKGGGWLRVFGMGEKEPKSYGV